MKLFALLVFVLLMPTFFAVAGTHEHSKATGIAPAGQRQIAPPKAFDSPQAEGTAATCPVTGDAFTIAKNTPSSQYNGKWVYFCCLDCKEPFDQNPGQYLLAPAHTGHQH